MSGEMARPFGRSPNHLALGQAVSTSGEMARPKGFEPLTFGSGGHILQRYLTLPLVTPGFRKVISVDEAR